MGITRGNVLVLLLGLQLAGCYRYTEIRKDQLPALNRSQERVVGTRYVSSGKTVGRVPIFESIVVLRPDGTTTEIRGAFHAIVGLRGEDEREFKHPVLSELQGQTLLVTADNSPQVALPLQDVEKVEIKQFSGWRTWTLVGVSAGAALLGALFLLQDTQPDGAR